MLEKAYELSKEGKNAYEIMEELTASLPQVRAKRDRPTVLKAIGDLAEQWVQALRPYHRDKVREQCKEIRKAAIRAKPGATGK